MINWAIIFITITVLSACSSVTGPIFDDRQVEYKKQKVAETDLEIPPDLTGSGVGDAMHVPGLSGTATYSTYASTHDNDRSDIKNSTVLPEVANVKVLRNGNQRWLEIQSTPEQVWQKIVTFWRANGVILIEQNPAVGIMKTDWLENRADIKQGFLTDLLRKAFDSVYSAATRDQFRVRLEPGLTANTTELYLTHQGMEEQMQGSVGGETENTFWVPRPNDPGLEAEMLRRIMLHLGVAEQAAGAELAQTQVQQEHATLEKNQDGQVALLIKGDLMEAWRLVGIAIERVGFKVEDRDRSAGTYYVTYDDPNKDTKPGFFSRLAFWSDTETEGTNKYRLQLQEITTGNTTHLSILDSNGQADTSETATRILTLVQEHIN